MGEESSVSKKHKKHKHRHSEPRDSSGAEDEDASSDEEKGGQSGARKVHLEFIKVVCLPVSDFLFVNFFTEKNWQQRCQGSPTGNFVSIS